MKLTLPKSLISIGKKAFELNPIGEGLFLGDRMLLDAVFDLPPIGFVAYCEGADGWPGAPFGGVVPIADCDLDRVTDSEDAFPFNAAESVDTDSDSVGNNADTDDDGDGLADDADAFPLDATETLDTDLDGTGNNADTDDDNDGVLDSIDAYPLIPLGDLTDTDSDGSPNNCDIDCQVLGMTADTDDDGDGVLDTADAFALISLGSLTDTDGDGRPDDCDSDCANARYDCRHGR